MSSSQRLTELIGIEPRRSPEASWPLNAALLALGAVILWIAFRFLQIDDPRWQYNPWSYAVATPLALVVLSMLLRTVASRGVERSMQIAFLLSILLHLLMSLYAANVVIFTRLWPEILEELAQERKMLERQVQPAPRYHNLAAARSKQRPDYLRYVPTTHKPSDVDDASEEALQLAKAHKTELVSPRPDIARSSTPHLVPREKSQLPPPQSNDRAAALSRSAARQPQPAPSSPGSSPELLNSAAEDALPEPIRPAEATAERSPGSEAALRQEFAEAVRSKSATSAAIARRDSIAAPQLADVPQNNPRIQTVPAPKRGSSVDVPEASSSSPEPGENALAASDLPAAESRTARDSKPLLALPAKSPNLKALAAPNNQFASRADRRAEMRVPMPLAGDMPSALARDSAGGRSSPAAPRSMPIQGIDSLATPEASEPDLNSALSSLALRNSQLQRATSGLFELGLPQGELASRTTSLSTGATGKSKAVGPQRAGQGGAASEDVAGLSGAGQAIQKSAVGVAGLPGPVELPSGDAAIAGESEAVSRLSPAESGRGRGDVVQPTYSPSRSATGLPGDGPSATQGGAILGAGVPEGLTRSSTAFTPAFGSQADATTGIARAQPAVGRKPASRGAIALPESAELEEPASPTDMRPAGGSAAELRRSTATPRVTAAPEVGQIELDLKADLGRGGLSNLSRDAVLVPRTGRIFEPLPMQEIDSQRFTRQAIGGPLAAGNSIPLPKPAFKQRLDRLKENQAADDSEWGPQTEQAIEAGLEFLAQHQTESGAWRLQDFDTKVLIRSDTAATALSLLSFQGAGYTHQQYQYASHVGKAIDYLVKNQRPNGDLYKPEDPASDQNAWLYSHAIASLALCEAYGMTQDPELREPAQRAINFMVDSQDRQRGGWRYRPGNGTDTSVSGWFMMAFKSGQLAGLDVPTPTFDRIEKYLDQSQVSKAMPHLYRYNPFAADTPEQRHGREPTAVMTSAGLLMRLYFGWQRGQPEMTAGADYLLEHPPAPGTKEATLRDTYYWYYSTQVLFHMGGERWKKWNSTLYPMLIQTQVTEGPQAGSWDPYRPTADLWARYGGRLYVTTLNLLSLEVNYRHLPLYDATAK